MALVNIPSLKPKLDMLIHCIQLNNIDMCFVTETWIQHGNEPEHQYIKANLDTSGYKTCTQSRENRKGRVAAIYKSHLHVKKLSFKEYTSFEALTVKLDITTKLYIFSTIYRAPYSTRQPVTMLTFLEEFPDHITSLFRSSNNILISGDFNIPWKKPREPRHHKYATNFGHVWSESTHTQTNLQTWIHY